MFQREIARARTFRERGERPDYWLGYECGLCRGHLGERFSTEQEHRCGLTLAADGAGELRERGQGYRDGLVVAAAELAA